MQRDNPIQEPSVHSLVVFSGRVSPQKTRFLYHSYLHSSSLQSILSKILDLFLFCLSGGTRFCFVKHSCLL